jgi:GTP cyclohydrolase II
MVAEVGRNGPEKCNPASRRHISKVAQDLTDRRRCRFGWTLQREMAENAAALAVAAVYFPLNISGECFLVAVANLLLQPA